MNDSPSLKMQTKTKSLAAFVRTSITFILFSLLLIAIHAGFLVELARFALRNDFCSHILLVPLISGWLLVRDREWLSKANRALVAGGIVIAMGAGLTIFAMTAGGLAYAGEYLSIRTFAILLTWLGGFLFFFGVRSFRVALFPLLFLVLMVPIPTGLLENIISHLQQGSAAMAAVLFKVTGTPYYREGTMFALPGTNIDVAPQCSGIRSSMALFITTLLAGYLMLKSGWRRLILVLVAIPMAMFKNSVRIVTLSLLGIHVDMRILTNSNLHHDGGILFFLLALLLMAPVLWILQRSEMRDGGS